MVASLFSSGLPVLWYLVLAVAVFAYSLGEGFDLGVSSIYFLARRDEEKRKLLNSIGPVWDGNEVWLIIVIAGLYAGFPFAYTTLLSVLYMPIWTLVALLIFRGVSLEFRSKKQSKAWTGFWDIVFSCSGTAIAFFLGTLAGNLIIGLPLGANIEYADVAWLIFFRPYPVLCGAMLVSAYALHGAIFSLMKTDLSLQERILVNFSKILSIFLVVFSVLVLSTTVQLRELLQGVKYPIVIGTTLFCFLSVFAAWRYVKNHRFGKAFLCSSMNLLLLTVSAATVLFPNLILSSEDSSKTITIYNSSVEAKTLQVLLIIVALGLPFVIAYAIYIYRVFRGKTDFTSIY